MGILEWAFDVRQFQVMGAPEWLKQQSFEILAGAENPSNEGQFKQMVQSLLADRFQLKVHRETRDVDVYALVVGKNGPKFDAAKSAPRNQGMGDIEVRPGRLFGRAATMDLLAHILTDNLERPVLDRTNLTGNYDFDLTYDQNSTGAGFTPLGGAIFVPIQDLGLKIEPQRDAVEVLVIDSIGRPSEN
jgi:uncharacterized protein (TIGR03435 family)